MKKAPQKRNENCLLEMSCPECHSRGPFRIGISAIAVVHDDGTDEITDPEWDNDSYCACMSCPFEGTVRGFDESKR